MITVSALVSGLSESRGRAQRSASDFLLLADFWSGMSGFLEVPRGARNGKRDE
ncbi:hypothetical protein [Actinocorallia sp. A-T 12471]|uniref:hypothetical protein n=1 Tax=Actinocorallia sp. A-T 12471 TaxID=3089813 RepID=UPI0029D03A73|nr:hypothetical protein [Actinocorallia sp. A-T 12471]MDX6744860.1 hypothetical protein [Actinocorallia sp. A-T 12471]